MSEIALVYVLFADRASATAIAREMVTARLAACVNVLAQGDSIYPWAGHIEQAAEVPVLLKTSLARRDALVAALSARHPYELPAILSWSATTTPAYAQWVAAGTTD